MEHPIQYPLVGKFLLLYLQLDSGVEYVFGDKGKPFLCSDLPIFLTIIKINV
jgi:hypothetical protein